MKETRGVENSFAGACRFRFVKRPPTIRPSPPQTAVARVPDGLLHKAPHHEPTPDSPAAGATTFSARPVRAENSTTSAIGLAGPPQSMVANTLDPSALISREAPPAKGPERGPAHC